MTLPDEPDAHDLLTTLAGPFTRLDAQPPQQWDWQPFPQPQHRFGSGGGLWRVRYAATTPAGAARERYADTGRYVQAAHADHYLVQLAGTLRVLDLRSERVLDALHLDARVSTSHEPQVQQVSWQLCDRARQWWGDEIHALVYTSRTTPETSANVAFYGHAPLAARARRLRWCRRLLDELVVTHGFTVAFDYR